MKKARYFMVVVAALLAVSLVLSCAPAPAPPAPPAPEWPPPKPEMIVIACYGIGSAGHAQTSAVAAGIYEKFGIKLRVVPIGTDVARALATRSESCDFWTTGTGYYLLQEGLAEWATIEWSAQPVRLIYGCPRQTAYGVMTTKESGIKTMADVKGKRVAYIIGNYPLNKQMEASLAFAGLTWDDVKKIDVPSYTAMVRALIDGKVDVTTGDSVSSLTYELESSPRGVYWVPHPFSDVEAWKRYHDIFPVPRQLKCSLGAGIDPDKPVETTTFTYPVLVSWDWKDEALCYWTAKVCAESWDLYKDVHPNCKWWALDIWMADMALPTPYHDGAVKYYKEAGVWTDKHEKRQQELVHRQKVLVETREATVAEFVEKGLKPAEYTDLWLKNRAEALKAAGL